MSEEKRIGPPLSKFKPERVAKILKDIGQGVPYKIAAESNGVADATFYDWMSKGMADLRQEIVSDYTAMVEALREIEKERIIRNQSNIENSPDGHEGAKWVLERCFWKYFSSKAPEIEFEERLSSIERKQGEAHEITRKGTSDTEHDSAEGKGTDKDGKTSLE